MHGAESRCCSRLHDFEGFQVCQRAGDPAFISRLELAGEDLKKSCSKVTKSGWEMVRNVDMLWGCLQANAYTIFGLSTGLRPGRYLIEIAWHNLSLCHAIFISFLISYSITIFSVVLPLSVETVT